MIYCVMHITMSLWGDRPTTDKDTIGGPTSIEPVFQKLATRHFYIMLHNGIDVTETYNTTSFRWRHDGRDSVSNHQPHDCLLNCLFRRWSKKTSKLRVTGLCAGNSLGTGEFDDVIMVYAWWCHDMVTLSASLVLYVGIHRRLFVTFVWRHCDPAPIWHQDICSSRWDAGLPVTITSASALFLHFYTAWTYGLA